MNKLDDLGRDLLPASGATPGQVYITSDLAALVGIVTKRSKESVEGASSLTNLWTLKPLPAQRDQTETRDGFSIDDSSSDDDDLLGNLFRRGPGVRVQRTLESLKG